MKVVVFDLDDTLYEELTFVRSGFKSVARLLNEHFQVNAQEAFKIMCDVLEKEGRGQVFNRVLSYYGLETRRNVMRCLSEYRLHQPLIELSSDADLVLSRLKELGYPVYIVTDGNKNVQYNKIKALGLEDRVEKCYITYRYGHHRSKPSPYCFELIAKREKVRFDEIVYVGDNPNKDFVGIKPLGFRTIRIRKGHFKNVMKSVEYNAEAEIETLHELLRVLVKWKTQT
ncbi:HAD family hydrolase [Paenibacillus sp. FSL W7-1088]|uniref:HAD family hydrolase n=1 Tax=Paenibacillus sp. FSL W7-1088 TaxID=2921695 RepID=UPI0030ECE631